MEKEKQIRAFLAKKSKSAIVLEMLLNREYVTCSDIINYGCENTPLVFTTSPHKLIEKIRNVFGWDFVKDREVKFFRTFYRPSGEAYKVNSTYKQYFLDKMAV